MHTRNPELTRSRSRRPQTVWNQDDCIAMKGGTNMLFERIHASGVGLTIGSLGKGHSSNITFRDSVMHHTYKGIYECVAASSPASLEPPVMPVSRSCVEG